MDRAVDEFGQAATRQYAAIMRHLNSYSFYTKPEAQFLVLALLSKGIYTKRDLVVLIQNGGVGNADIVAARFLELDWLDKRTAGRRGGPVKLAKSVVAVAAIIGITEDQLWTLVPEGERLRRTPEPEVLSKETGHTARDFTEAQIATTGTTVSPKRRGRPPGSKNSPPGSKNKSEARVNPSTAQDGAIDMGDSGHSPSSALLYVRGVVGLGNNLLTREEEQQLGQNIEKARQEILQAVCGDRERLEYLHRCYAETASGAVRVYHYTESTSYHDGADGDEGGDESIITVETATKDDVIKQAAARIATLCQKMLAQEGAGEAERDNLVNAVLGQLRIKDSVLIGLGESIAGDAIKNLRRVKEVLIQKNLRLALSVAKKFTGRGELFEDLVQAGNLGLIAAVDKYDYRHGHKFSTYAIHWIRQCVLRQLHEESQTIHMPVHVQESLATFRRAMAKIVSTGNKPTIAALAQATQMQEKDVGKALRLLAQTVASLDAPMGQDDEDGYSLHDVIPDQHADPAQRVLEEERMERLIFLIDTFLPKREADVLRLRFGIGGNEEMILEEVGGQLGGITRERVRQIQNSALQNLGAAVAATECYSLTDMRKMQRSQELGSVFQASPDKTRNRKKSQQKIIFGGPG